MLVGVKVVCDAVSSVDCMRAWMLIDCCCVW